ncbi:hypothetical protein [Pasteurella canis]|uniref:hypothetical protein n=1 Tax=Pasteurella canis TaxID=753 RepID=UPI0013283FCA|nr:hypothetical protein [Pasteurella canis]MXN88557.1 hypothetical protein [Pasteurella canis]
MDKMEDIIEEILSNAFEEFGIDGKGKTGDIARAIHSDIKLISGDYSSVGHNCDVKEDKSSEKNYIIEKLRWLPFCTSCDGKGVQSDGISQCIQCKGTGRNIKFL